MLRNDTFIKVSYKAHRDIKKGLSMNSTATRKFINHATRLTNLNSITSEGVQRIKTMFQESLKGLENFKYFLVYMFQEIVAEDIIMEIYEKLTALEADDLEVVLTEIAERYTQFARLGCVFTVKNYIDTL